MSQCVNAIVEIGGKDANGKDVVSAREAAELLREIQKRARNIQATNAGMSAMDAIDAAGAEFKLNAKMVATVQKRNAYLGRLRKLQAVDMIRTHYAGDYERGIKSLTVGTQGGEVASRFSAASEIESLTGEYEGGFMADVNRVDGGVDIVNKGLLGKEVANVLWSLNTPGAKLDGMDPRAIELGKVIHKWQEVARTYANKAGAWIGKLDGYIVTQSHDMYRIAKDREGWMAAMREHADLERMLRETEADDVDDLLHSLYQGLSTGVHLKTMPGNGEPPSKGLKGMARGLSHDRVIHFKSADAWSAYNDAFGEGSVYDAAMSGLQNTARATGVMRVFGPNHEATFDGIVAELMSGAKKANDPQFATFKDKAKHVKEWYLHQVDGTNTIVGNDMVSTGLRLWRMVQSMASLGGSLLASLADTATIATGAKFNGMNALGTVAESVGNFAKLPKSQAQLDAFADMGLAFETMANMLVSDRFGIGDPIKGALGRLQRSFFTWNGQRRWTDAMRAGVAMGLSSNLARRAGQSFSELTPDLQRTLGTYGIDEGMWNLFRKGALREVEGRQLLTPSAIKSLPDDELAAYLDSMGQPSTGRAVSDLRFEMERKWRGYFTDQNRYMMLAPDAATTGALNVGSRADTATGQIIRSIMQFKSFSIAFSQRVLTREVKQHGLEGVAKMLVLTTMAGYAAMSMKDLFKGKTPRDPSRPGTWMAAMAQGGGLGIYGDLLTSQVLDRRMDAGMALLGPTVGDIAGTQGLAGIASRAAEGRDPSAAALRFAQGNTPFINLFYTKIVLDYLVFFHAQEVVNPGSLRRMEREMENNTGQQYIYPPSQYRPGAGP